MQKTGFNLIVAAVLAATSVSAHADFLGIYAGVDGYFSQTNVSEGSNNDTKLSGAYSLAFEHPVPFVPNGKLRYSKIDKTTTNIPALINDEPGHYDETLSIESLDAIAYYEILDNIVSIDVGAGAKKINTQLDWTSGALSESFKYDDTLPALYAAAGGKLPLTGLSAKAEVFAGKSSDADFTDFNAEIKYDFVETLLVNVGAKIGYRNMKVNVDDNKNIEQATMKGPYLGVEVHF